MRSNGYENLKCMDGQARWDRIRNEILKEEVGITIP
jgi:hypothetical protein